MNVFESVTRTIQFYGLFRPPSDRGRIYYSRLWFDILQYPRTRYENFRYEPPQTFYGYVQAMSAERVVWYKQIEFDNQLIWENYDSTDLLHRSLVCHLDAVNQSFINLGLAQGLPPIEVSNPIKDRLLPVVPVDEFRIRFFDEKVVGQMTLEYALSLDCDLPLSVPPPPPPPLPDRPPEPFLPPPPGEPPNPGIPPISDAYDGDEDGGLTYKPEEGEPENPYPIGDECQVVEVVVSAQLGNGQPYDNYTDFFWGPIDDIRLGVDPASGTGAEDDILVVSRGQSSFENCSPTPVIRSIVQNNVTDFVVVSVTPQ